METDDVRDQVIQIRNNSGDDETAHVMEDRLHQAVLQAIADGTAENPAELAAEALKTNNIRFERWCA